jgi:ketosteroid isomerase-like protein
MDTTALLQAIYAAYREKRLSDVLDYLDDSFRYVVHLPDELLQGGNMTRDKQATRELFSHFMDTYDFLAFDPGPIIVTGDRALVNSNVRFRHKQSGKQLTTRIQQTWEIKDGKAVSLDEQHDQAAVEAFLKSIRDEQP